MDSSTLQFMAPPVLGGALAGVASIGLMLTHGRIAGVSGHIVASADPGASDRGSRVGFLAGLVAVGLVLGVVAPQSIAVGASPPLAVIAAAGLAIGFGSRLANGCTSGHGVCGVGRLSPRSIVSVSLFTVVGALALWISRLLLGGAS